MLSRKLSTAFQLGVLFLGLQIIIFIGVPFWPGSSHLRAVSSTLTSQKLSYPWSHSDLTQADLSEWESSNIKAIMDPSDTSTERLECPTPNLSRYTHLTQQVLAPGRRSLTPRWPSQKPQPKYFFALDLYQCAPLLPRLLGSIVEAIRYLGPENCALSIVEGRSKDGTGEVLDDLKAEMKKIGATYYLQHSSINPLSGPEHRFKLLADLRNLVLSPLIKAPSLFSPDTTVIFINDIALCMEDILELLHQRVVQSADMVCAMDYINPEEHNAMFYDVYISRQINGDTFFHIPANSSWDAWADLFWNDEFTKQRYNAGKPFQVYSCWNGITTFTAKPIMAGTIQFRQWYEDECVAGEPTILCKDFWYHGFGKIAVVPSVAVGYDDEKSRAIKKVKGTVSEWVQRENANDADYKIEWKGPPKEVNCAPEWDKQRWVPWDEGLAANSIAP